MPPQERPQRPGDPDAHHGRRHGISAPIIFSIVLFAVTSVYLSLIVVTQADDIFFPGNEFGTGFFAKIPGVDSAENPDFANINERINVLFLGLDLRRDEPADMAARTDSVFVLTMDPYAKTAGIFSIPRDTWVDIPTGFGGYSKGRINEAYERGLNTDYPGDGPGLAMDTIEYNFGIPIDHYVVLNFNNFIDLVDELGGIDVNIPEYAYDPAYNDCNYCSYYPVEFEPGTEHMDGERALAYARIRHSDNDFKRIERQQLVIRATAKRAMDLGKLLGSNPIDLYGQYKDAVKTDISDFLVPGLAALGRQIGIDNIRMVSMAPATYGCGDCGAAVLLWDPDKVEALKEEVFNDGRLQGEYAIVRVLNGTNTPDLASDFASFLRSQGLGSAQISVDEYADGQLYDSTVIVDLSGKSYTASRLAQWLQLPDTRILSGSDPQATPFLETGANVVVVLGADAELPQFETQQTGG